MADREGRLLAIMMKAPRAGHVKTRLGSAFSAERILTLYRALVEDTIDLARAMRVHTVAVCPAGDESELARWLSSDVAVVPQHGTGLAAGLHSTFEQLCTPDRRSVIAFNADSPHLPAGALEAAFTALANNDLVVGPCDDGGYYLVGSKEPYAGLFDAGVMGRGTACAMLVGEAARRGLRVALNVEHYDIDVPSDVTRLVRELSLEPSRASRTAAILKSWSLEGPADG